MEAYLVHGTTKTPEIHLDPVASTLVIKGRCIPENTIEFFAQILNAIEVFGKSKPKKFEITI